MIELMIVVGVIGILVSIATPQFRKYQNRARQSEAKVALSAIYALQKAFYSEYSAYIPVNDAIGFTPEGNRRFYHQGLCTVAPWGGTISGYSGTTSVNNFSTLNSPFTITGVFNPAPCAQVSCASYGNDPQFFHAWSHGNLGTAYDDMWQIDHLKVLRNCSVGL